jgi:hypothetical protein
MQHSLRGSHKKQQNNTDCRKTARRASIRSMNTLNSWQSLKASTQKTKTKKQQNQQQQK